jgi:dolichol-phosphate mannosyltransferase
MNKEKDSTTLPFPTPTSFNTRPPSSLSLVMPAYNEEQCIREVVVMWQNKFKELNISNCHLIIVNDGSKDETGKILDQLALEFSNMIVIHQKNGGHGAALLNGIRKALTLPNEYVFHVDSDNQFMPEDFKIFWERRNTSPFLLGHRKQRHDPFHRLVITRILRLLLWLTFQVNIPDANIPFRLMKKDFLFWLVHSLPPNIFAPNIFLSVLAARLKIATGNFPVHHVERKTGTISIVRLKLLKVCWQSWLELVNFRRELPGLINSLQTRSDEQSKNPPIGLRR